MRCKLIRIYNLTFVFDAVLVFVVMIAFNDEIPSDIGGGNLFCGPVYPSYYHLQMKPFIILIIIKLVTFHLHVLPFCAKIWHTNTRHSC